MITLLFLVLGLFLLTAGAEFLVRGASALAGALGISPLVIGLTVVAFGTSAPEFVVSVAAGVGGQPDLALGNVVGSNIFNVLFILGISALIVPLVVSRQLVVMDVPVMIGVSALTCFLAMDGKISRMDGALLFAGIVVYTAVLIRIGRKETQPPAIDDSVETQRMRFTDIARIAAGLTMLILGSRWLVSSAITIAQYLGVSELIIGLTIVAAGTSLPEVATSIVASIRGERDIAVGNVVGSNIFNLLAVLGMSAVVSSGGVEVAQSALRFDLPVMLAVALACLPIFFTGHSIARWEGALFLFYYVAYSAYLILASTQHDALPVFSDAMAWFALPLTVVTLVVLSVRSLRQGTANVPARQ